MREGNTDRRWREAKCMLRERESQSPACSEMPISGFAPPCPALFHSSLPTAHFLLLPPSHATVVHALPSSPLPPPSFSFRLFHPPVFPFTFSVFFLFCFVFVCFVCFVLFFLPSCLVLSFVFFLSFFFSGNAAPFACPAQNAQTSARCGW